MSYAQPRGRRLEALLTVSTAYTGSGWRLLVFDAPAANTAGFVESSDVFTCTIPGVYSVCLPIQTNGLAYYVLSAYKNGSIVALTAYSDTPATLNSAQNYESSSFEIELAVGDTIALYFYPSGNSTSYTDFSGKPMIMELIS